MAGLRVTGSSAWVSTIWLPAAPVEAAAAADPAELEALPAGFAPEAAAAEGEAGEELAGATVPPHDPSSNKIAGNAPMDKRFMELFLFTSWLLTLTYGHWAHMFA